jgi:hypothetical protein
MRSITMMLTALALVLPVFGQGKQETKTEKSGMVWYWFDGAKKCNVDWDTATAERDKAFANLTDKVKEGDKNKIRLYMGKVNEAQFKISMAWACGSDYSRNLEQEAGGALGNTSDISTTGKMTEAEYDEAMALVKTLRKKIENRPVSAGQKKIWDDAVKTSGADPEFYKLSN